MSEVRGGGGDGAVEGRKVPADDVDAGADAVLKGEGDADLVGFSHPCAFM
jgi:hypothetical protein